MRSSIITADEGNKLERFAPCPNSPNCVSSVNPANKGQAIQPFFFEGEVSVVRERLLSIIGALRAVEVVTEEPEYLHFIQRSRVFKFADDVEIKLDPDQKRIDFKSASRQGYLDFGVNRSRIEQIKAQLRK